MECCRLRQEVFFGDTAKFSYKRLDVDRFDYRFDHLYIEHIPTQKIIGTYRLRVLDSLKHSYTQQEFKLEGITAHNTNALELGRACILNEFRKGAVIALLWRGIAEYMLASKVDYLFGCSSIYTTSAREIAMIYSYLGEKGAINFEQLALPQTKYELPDFDMWISFYKDNLNDVHRQKAKELVPSLLNSYMRMGAQIASLPALDKSFGCVDFLTLVHKNVLLRGSAQRFFDGSTKDQSRPSLSPTEGITISSQ